LILQKQNLTVSYIHEKNTYFTDGSLSDQKLEIGSLSDEKLEKGSPSDEEKGKEFIQLFKAHYA
jgi:hypothetical protein